MRSETATAGRVRIVIALAVAGALTFMVGLLLVVVGVAMQTVGKHPDPHVIALGAETAVAGFSFGMIVLAILVLIRGGISAPADRGKQYKSASQARGAGVKVAGGTGASGGARWAAGGPRQAGAPPPGRPAAGGGGPGGRTGAGQPGREPNGQRAQGANGQPPHTGRPRREQVLNPTSVFTPGGLLDMPGSAPRGAFAQDQAPPARTQQGQGQGQGQGASAGPGPGGYRAGARPPTAPTASASPAGTTSQRPNWAAPGAARQPGQYGQPPQPGQNSPQDRRPAGPPAPPRGPQQQSAGSQQQSAGSQQQSAGPQQAAGPRESVWPDPGYAAPAPPEEMYVYRDDGSPEEPLTPTLTSAEVDEREAAYWYGTGDPEPPAPEPEARGPFEPLVSSGSLPQESLAEGAGDAGNQPADEPEEDPADQHAQKLEQIKDFYLTAEAIGEENVDKHFDQLLAQQRDLINQYFKHSRLRGAADGAASAEVPAQEQAAPADAPDGAAQAGAASASTDW